MLREGTETKTETETEKEKEMGTEGESARVRRTVRESVA